MFLLPRESRGRGGEKNVSLQESRDKPDRDTLAPAAALLAREIVSCILVCLLTLAVRVAA